ncbi:MAG: SIS domain-containing protein, partial [Selenomonadaceae bacterium]
MIKDTTKEKINDLIVRYPCLADCRSDLEVAVNVICDCYRSGGKILVCGNGGSASDSEHIVGELMKGFLKKRPIKENFYNRLKETCPEYADYLRDRLYR